MATDNEITRIEINYSAGGINKKTLENKNDLVLRVFKRKSKTETRHKSCLSLARELCKTLVPRTARVYDLFINRNAREVIYPYAEKIIYDLARNANILSYHYIPTSEQRWQEISKRLLIDLASYF